MNAFNHWPQETSLLWIFIFFVALLVPFVASGASPEFAGRWEYIQPPDREGEVLDLWESGSRYRGIMNGLERAGEHGLFYFVVEVQKLNISTESTISFVVGERSFFARRPSLSVLDVTGDSGHARDLMRFEGRLDGADLVLRCSGSGGSCPAEIMRFKRVLDR
jgi:hypothetical protein